MALSDYFNQLNRRWKAASHVFRHGLQGIPAKDLFWQDDVSAEDMVPWFQSAWKTAQPAFPPTDFRTFVEEGFDLNSLIQSALVYKARSKMLVPLRAYIGDPSKPDLLPPDHPLQALCMRPNRFQGWAEFGARYELFFNLGNAFILLARPPDGGLPYAMYTLRPDLVRIIPEDWGVQGYIYMQPNREPLPILPEDMVHIKYPNHLLDPLNGFGFGLPPTSISQSADVDNEITKFLKLFFKNGAMPPGILTYDVPLQAKDIKDIRTRWRELYGGAQNWLEPGILDQGGSYQKVGSSFQEMGFSDIDERDESRILGPFGVPPILLGTRMGLSRSTYSNYREARTAYWEDTAEPELQLSEDEFRYFLQSQDGGFVAFDRSRVPALRDKVPDLVKAARSLWDMGTPLNQALRSVGVAMEDVPGGDIAYLRAGYLPVNIADQSEVSMEDAPDAESDTDRTPDEDIDPESEHFENEGIADAEAVDLDDLQQLEDEIESLREEASRRLKAITDAAPTAVSLNDALSPPTLPYIRVWRNSNHPTAQKMRAVHREYAEARRLPVLVLGAKGTAPDDEEFMANILVDSYLGAAEMLVEQVMEGELSPLDFELELDQLTEELGDELVMLGSGEAIEHLPYDQVRLLIEQESENGNSAADFSSDLFTGLTEATSDTEREEIHAQANDRLLLWAGIAAGLFYLGRLFRKDNPELVWEYSPGKDHCTDCTALNGVIRSAEVWLNSGVRPRSYSLECRGFYCECRLLLVPK